MCSMGVLFFTNADSLTRWFVSEENIAVAKVAAPLLRIVAFSMPSLAVTMVLIGALRGAGDTRWPLFITLLGFLGVRLPLTYWLTSPAMGFGVEGAWYAMITDIVFRSVLVLARFSHGGWKTAVV